MKNERHSHERELKEAEREIYEVNRTLATVQAGFEKMQKEMIALQ
jgi:predicted  nucleic acid-binding Zn-ribbon protein